MPLILYFADVGFYVSFILTEKMFTPRENVIEETSQNNDVCPWADLDLLLALHFRCDTTRWRLDHERILCLFFYFLTETKIRQFDDIMRIVVSICDFGYENIASVNIAMDVAKTVKVLQCQRRLIQNILLSQIFPHISNLNVKFSVISSRWLCRRSYQHLHRIATKFNSV